MVWIEKFVEVDSFGIVRIKSAFLFLKFCLIIIWSLLIWIDSKILCFLYFRVCRCEVSLIVMGFARKYDKRVAWCTALKYIIVLLSTQKKRCQNGFVKTMAVSLDVICVRKVRFLRFLNSSLLLPEAPLLQFFFTTFWCYRSWCMCCTCC